MQKCFTLFVAVLVTVTVLSAAGVATVQRADAKPAPPPDYYNIPISVNEGWKGKQCNVHTTWFGTETTAQHTETSTGDAATLAIYAAPGQMGINSATVGIQYRLTGITDWDAVKDRHVALTYKITYILAAKGGSAGASIGMIAGPGLDQVHGPDGYVKKTVTQTYTTTFDGRPLTVADLAYGGANGNYDGELHIGLQCGVGAESGSSQQATALVTAHSLGITYL